MDYERFKEGFQDALKAELAVRGADVELTARRVDKMNDSYDAITVRPVDSSIGVNISVEKAFAAYENGTPIPEIAEHFADAVEKGFRESPQVDLESLSDYEQMKSKLSMEVVSAEKNAELLESVPHERMEDMAVVYGVEEIDEIFDIILDVLCSNQKFITISGDKKPINVVKSRFMKLDSSHIQFVMDSMKDKTTKVRNVKKYIVAALYNAPITINNYYQSLVQHDMATGKI